MSLSKSPIARLRSRKGGVALLVTLVAFAVASTGFAQPAFAANGAVSQAYSGRCIDLPGGNTTDGTQLELWDCNGGSNQAITQTSARELRIDGKCVDAYNGGTTNGAILDLWTCSGAVNQKWTIESNGSIKSDNGLCIDGPGGHSANGTLLDVWACDGGTNQSWNGLTSGGGSGSSNPTVQVDLSYSLGSVVHGSAGALYGLSQNGTPPASDLSGLNFQTIAQMAPGGTQHPDGDALKVGPEFYGAGGKNVLIYLQDYYPSWPYAKVSMSDYSNLVKSEVAKVQAAPNASKYIYVPFNEPDWIWYGPSGSKLTSFENDWKTIFQAIRSANSSAQIAGPNFENYNDAAYKSFLSFAKANNVLPNLITWHELTLSTLESSWYTHINDYRADESSLGISPIPVDIDEYGQQSDMGVPGKMIEYLARFDADRVQGDMSSWYAGEYLGRTLNSSGQKTSGWYLYYWYGQQNGNSARVTPPDGNGALQAVASIASDKKSARAIIGGAAGSNNITFSGLSSTSLGSSPKVTISTLSNSGDSQSGGPSVTSTYTGSVSNGTITVTVSNMAANNVYLVTLG